MARENVQAKIGRPAAHSSFRRLRLDRESETPLYRQVYERLRDVMETGALASGARLPSSRSLASQLALARATVANAYDLLSGDGFITGHGSAGTYVTPRASLAGVRRSRLQARPAAMRTDEQSLLRVGQPALDEFPRKMWMRLERQRSGWGTETFLGRVEPQGLESFRATVANRLAITRGIKCGLDQIFVTAGYQGALLLVASAVVNPGDTVWVEDPGDVRVRTSLALARARSVPVRVDKDGINVAAGMMRAPQARLAVVTPCHQFPLGMALSQERRAALYSWACEGNAYIVEDDYDNEIQYDGKPFPPICSADADGRVIYVASFSKILFPGLKLSCVVVPRHLLAAFERAAVALPQLAGIVEQHVLGEFIRRGLIGQHVNRMRRLYSQRRSALLAALRARRSLPLRVESPIGGMHLIAWLPDGWKDAEIAARANAQALGIAAVSSYAVSGVRPGLLLGFAATPQERAESAVSRLADVITSYRRR